MSSSPSTPQGTPSTPSKSLAVPSPPRISGHGRPLSTIESVTSASSASSDDGADASGETGSDDGDDNDDDAASTKMDLIAAMRRSSTPPARRPAVAPTFATRRSSHDLRSQVLALFNRCVPASDGESDGEAVKVLASASAPDKVVPVKALPRLLQEYEAEMGKPLIEPELQPQLDHIIEQTPELPLGADDLVGLIHALEAAREADLSGGAEAETSRDRDDDNEAAPPADTSMDSSMDDSLDSTASSSDDDEEKRWAGASTPQRPRYPSTGRPEPRPFPRSVSDHADLTVVVEDESSPGSTSRSSRRKTTSDPSVSPYAAAKQRGSSGSEDKKDRSRERRVSSSARESTPGEEREVLKGKGRAKGPPSAWNRPRPQALARSRRVSDASSVVSQDQGDDGDSVGSGAWSARRRGVSGPISPAGTSDSPVVSPTSQMPRSASGGFSFPRAMSPDSGWMAGEIDRWNQGSYDDDEGGGGYGRPRTASSRGASPEIDDSPAGFHTFSALENPPKASSVSGHRSRNSIGGNIIVSGAGADQAELQIKLEALRKLMADRDAKHEEVASQQETMISELQGEIEELKASLAQKKKEEKERNWRIQGDQDQIALMEAELNKVNAALEAARQQAANFKSDYEDQLTETERQRSRNTDMAQQLSTSRETEVAFAEAEAQWSSDRETYRETIRGLNERVAELEMLSAELEASQAEARVLRETIERLNAELEEARRGGSSFVVGDARGAKAAGANGSMPASVSKRLGSELARYFAEHEEDDVEEFEEELNEAIEEGGDASTDSIIETIIRRRRRTAAGKKSSSGSSGVTYADAGMQTSGGDEAGPSRGVEPEPPTYDEAALEKALTARLHPSCGGATAGLPSSSSGSTLSHLFSSSAEGVEAYEILKRHLGARCTVLEELLEARGGAAAVEQEIKPAATMAKRLTTAAAPWANKAMSALPSSAQTYIRIATDAVPSDDSSRMALLSALMFVLGVTAGGALFSPGGGGGGGLVDATSALGLEKADAWRVSNSLGVGLVGPGLVEWGAALGAGGAQLPQPQGWWGWLMLRGAQAVGVVPT